jgi:chromosome segregation ATPase
LLPNKETNIRVQQSIDKLLNMFEDTNKQLSESYLLQSQLADKLDEKQKELHETHAKINHMEQDNEHRLRELIDKLSNYEGLAESYENDLEKKKREIEQLEERLEACTKELNSAHSVIESEEKELSSMEYMRKELVAQRTLFANELQDSNIKGTTSSFRTGPSITFLIYILHSKSKNI